jgi:hypothetical protein
MAFLRRTPFDPFTTGQSGIPCAGTALGSPTRASGLGVLAAVRAYNHSSWRTSRKRLSSRRSL